MNRNIFYNIFIIIALAFGCNKVKLDPVDGNPVFSAEAMFDGQPKSWQAGVDDYYMFSEFEKDDFDVYVFTGRFAKNDSTFGESLAFYIRDFQQVPSGSPAILDALNPGRVYGFYNLENTTMVIDTTFHTIGWTVNFDASSTILIPNQGANYKWFFGDGTEDSVSVNQITHTYDSTILNATVSLSVISNNSIASGTIQKTIELGQNSPSCDVDLMLNYDPLLLDSTVELIAQPIGIQPFNYSWNSGSLDSFIVFNSPSGYVSGAVTVTDATGCIVSASMVTEINQGAIPPICVAKFNYDFSPEITTVYDTTFIHGDSLQFSKILIEYISDGINYRSDKFLQNPNAFFKIIEVSDYDNNEKGEKTKKMTIEYTCRLWNEFGEYIDVTDGKAVIAVAYP
jgi:PKD repeat protein